MPAPSAVNGNVVSIMWTMVLFSTSFARCTRSAVLASVRNKCWFASCPIVSFHSHILGAPSIATYFSWRRGTGFA